ncbi:MAG: EAL and GGDEF domain-containing protein [Halomonas sp.]|jgi:EAL domain-containing protein (putative c-di-GMP-specific phosphodiesterase class I)/GGDEF domain-containing protein|uniref:bifunctional diguanylate cyclase/phosphodiesterase n=1 Tax=Halomonas sp. MCCC 1A11057 TaxID=2733482 RepID=UPI001F2D3AC7|nr:bifunctional diguanylate cyclase/phosphodiesterase [Halomonas sp. MCCC 1A11057]MCE8033879.1 EAL and GGDEF domain-containing protein [Halomonas sp. MCCC 1A11057]MDX5434911.1 EAL and GGDEF domain-containing protein [Halomonas sp.]
MSCREEQELRAIIEGERLTPCFQPIVDVGRQRVHGYEALIRGPEGARLHSPLALFDAAMRQGLLVELDLMCRRLAIAAFVRLGLPGRLFLNVMPSTIVERDFREGLTLGYLREHGLAPNRVVIELTEHVPIHDYALMRQAVAHYRDMGFQVALDDLGAGHSSLRHWAELRPDFVKLDRHFIAGIDREPGKQEFLRSILDVARSLGCLLIAEGVETAEEYRCLWELDRSLSLLQGYYFARPSLVPPQVIERFLPGGAPLRQEKMRSARAVLRPLDPITPRWPVLNLAERFRADPNLRCVAVVDEGRPVGVIRRNEFLTLFTNPYSHALFAKRQVKELIDPRVPIAIDETPLTVLSQQITDNRDAPQEDFVIVDAQGCYQGMGNIVDLLREITAIQVRQARHANPLTGLPGNLLINETLGEWLEAGAAFTAVYCDLDNFKAYNDAYGYARGDRVIVALAQLLDQEMGRDDFLGHIGGDDFMLLLAGDSWERRCHAILEAFGGMAPGFYDAEERRAGGVRIKNRQGQVAFYPFVSLSLAARPVRDGRGCDPLAIAAELSELKQQAKRRPGNSLFVERRRLVGEMTAPPHGTGQPG